eukprot:NODE_352_length_10276_cov_0.244178.p7 type:complete len:155 gc:universal NODE_352_length_10276_cov_0.244178:3184-2720(-)
MISRRARVWHLFDAKDEILGRLSAKVASTLQGKRKKYYSSNEDLGDYCVVINANHVNVTGRKEVQKVYHTHSGWPGGLKSTLYKDMQKVRVIEIGVKGMLPRNMLRDQRFKRLFVFPESIHPYGGNIMKIEHNLLNAEYQKSSSELKKHLQIDQ